MEPFKDNLQSMAYTVAVLGNYLSKSHVFISVKVLGLHFVCSKEVRFYVADKLVFFLVLFGKRTGGSPAGKQ